MEWIADPMAAGGWLRERLVDDWSMHHFAPRGFEAYARVFHPAEVRSLPDQPVPTMGEWMRMPEAEQQRLAESFVDEQTTWAAAADAFGTTMHPLAQWHRLLRNPRDGDSRTAPDGREFTGPGQGRMPESLLARIASNLVQHTRTPDAGFVAVWEGWGGLVGGLSVGSSRAFLEFSDEPVHERMLQQSIHDRFNNPFRRPTWRPGILSDEISKGARLSLPDRDHVLFSAAPSVFVDPDWILDAPWRDREGETHGFAPSAQHPSVVWPADQAWVMTSEIDDDSTIIAGSAALIQQICADATIEALPIPEGSSLHWDSDDINR